MNVSDAALTPPPGQEAMLRYFDVQLHCAAIKILPGQYFLAGEDIALCTVLGSCVAVCLWDAHARLGGMNHFLLPDAPETRPGGQPPAAPARYGSHAMRLLLGELLHRGAQRSQLRAKVFGGARLLRMATDPGAQTVGAQNTEFVRRWLRRENIPVLAHDVLGHCPRRVMFFPGSGRALVKRLNPQGPQSPQGIV